MKIIKETPYLMIIKDRDIPLFFAGAIFVLVGLINIFYPKFFDNNPSRETRIGVILLILWGLFVISVAKITTIKLDKNANKLTIVTKSLFGRKMEERDLNQIKTIELHISYYQDEKERGYSYKLFFILENNEEIPLPSPGGVVRAMGKQITNERIRIIGARIASFLNIQFQERRPPTISETLSAIQKAVQEEIEKHKKE
jgi:hypothetical protein